MVVLRLHSENNSSAAIIPNGKLLEALMKNVLRG